MKPNERLRESPSPTRNSVVSEFPDEDYIPAKKRSDHGTTMLFRFHEEIP